jgi:aarF domain-containing kinase
LTQGISFRLFTNVIGAWWNYAYWTTTLKVVEIGMDSKARLVKINMWVKGLSTGGLSVANEQAAGLL